jgi:hypothetical protein
MNLSSPCLRKCKHEIKNNTDKVLFCSYYLTKYNSDYQTKFQEVNGYEK